MRRHVVESGYVWTGVVSLSFLNCWWVENSRNKHPRFERLELNLDVIHGLDSLLDKLKRREKDGIDGARAAHGDTQAAVHMALEELDLYGLHFLALGIHEGIALVETLGRVDRICPPG